jgi:hypothetical protein
MGNTEKKCRCKNWGDTIKDGGGLSINSAFPADAELLPLVEVALSHLSRQWPGIDFGALGTPREILRELRQMTKFNEPRVARMAPRQHWVSYAVKAIRHGIQDLYFRDTEVRNPFKMPGMYVGQSPAEVLQYRDFARKVRDARVNPLEAPDESGDVLESLDNGEFEKQLQMRFPILWAMRQGFSMVEIRGFLGEIRKSKVSEAQLREDILAEACAYCQLSNRPLGDMLAALEPELSRLRGSRGAYKGASRASADPATTEMVREALRRSA